MRESIPSRPVLGEPEVRLISDDDTTEEALAEESSSEPPLLNLNTATEAQLAALPGMNLQLAQVAIQARDEQNGFQSLDEFTHFLGLSEFDCRKIQQLACAAFPATTKNTRVEQATEVQPQRIQPQYRMID